jgi:hypothetical protein
VSKFGLVFVAACTLACGKSDNGSGSTKPKTEEPPEKPIDLAAVNALVPASLKDKVTFEKAKIIQDRGDTTSFTVAAPKGWKQRMKGFAHLSPESDLATMTVFEVGSNCDGACERKEWATVLDKVYASYLSGKVLKDVKGKTSRTLIAESGTTTVVVVAWWEEGASKYWHCGATLESDLRDLAPAIEKACESVTIVGDD